MSKATDDRKVRAFLRKADAKNRRERAARVDKLRRAMVTSDFFEWELGELERLVFCAYGRNQLGAHPQ
jgi:hypothetical protein